MIADWLWVSGSFSAHLIHVLIARIVIFIALTVQICSLSFPTAFSASGANWSPILKISCWLLELA